MNFKRILTGAAAVLLAVALGGCAGGGQTYLTGAEAAAKSEELGARLATLATLTPEQLSTAFPGVEFGASIRFDAALPGLAAAGTDSAIGFEAEASFKAALAETDLRAEASAAFELSVPSSDLPAAGAEAVKGALSLRYQLDQSDPQALHDYALIVIEEEGQTATRIAAREVLPYLTGALTFPGIDVPSPDPGTGVGDGNLSSLAEFFLAQAETIRLTALSARERDGKYEFELDVKKALSDDVLRAAMVEIYRSETPQGETQTDAQYEALADAFATVMLTQFKITAGGRFYLSVTLNAEGLPVALEAKAIDVALRVETAETTLVRVTLDAAVKLEVKPVTVAALTLADFQTVYPDIADPGELPTLEAVLTPPAV